MPSIFSRPPRQPRPDFIPPLPRRPTAGELRTAAANVAGLPVQHITNPGKPPAAIAHPRQAAMALALWSGVGLKTVAVAFKRHHTSALYTVQSVDWRDERRRATLLAVRDALISTMRINDELVAAPAALVPASAEDAAADPEASARPRALPGQMVLSRSLSSDDAPVDTSDVPEVGEEWFARAKLRLPGKD